MGNPKKPAIFFSPSSRTDIQLPESNAILVYPSSDGWNDFRHRTRFEFVFQDSLEKKSRRFFLAFIGDKQPLDIIKENLGPENYVRAESLPQFFSMQFSMDDYREIVSEFGMRLAESILLSLNDLVASKRSDPYLDWVNEAVETEVFGLSFVRNSESLYAFYNARKILDGVSFNAVDKAPTSLRFTFKLEEFKNEHKFDFEFSNVGIVPSRIAVLIGKNGVGKSQTLKKLANAALDGEENLTDGSGKRPLLNRLIAVATAAETEATFPSETKIGARIDYRRISALSTERHAASSGTLPETLLQLARRGGVLGGEERWKIFTKTINHIVSSDTLYVVPNSGQSDVKADPFGAVEIDSLRFGGELKTLDAARQVDKDGEIMKKVEAGFVPLSSGQMSFLRLAAHLCLHVDNGCLVLMDEPETHLHPNLISDLVSMLNEILELSGSIAIIATHSAYLVREVASNQVHIIREKEGKEIEILRPRLKTFGADVGAISNFIFGDEIINRLLGQIEDAISQGNHDAIGWEEKLKAYLSAEALMELKQRIKGNGQ